MYRFLLTSEKFTGSAEIRYNEEGRLELIDLRGTSISKAGAHQLIVEIIPATVSQLKERLTKFTTITCVAADYTVTLDDFKKVYPYARNMHLLPPLWGKMTTSDQVLAVKRGEEYRDYCKRNTWYKPKIAAAWLTSKEYLNDWKTL